MKILKKIKNSIKIWAVNEIFKLYYGRFLYPFENADITYKKLPAYKKAIYLRDVNAWVNSEAFKIENQEYIRGIYADLATKPKDDIMTNAYRLALLVARDNEIRLRDISKKFDDIKEVS